LKLVRHIPFLIAVLKHSITAFGGPQVHLGLLHNRFVEKRKDVTSEELMEYNAFCQLLPGASSTQTIILVAFKRGGTILAFLTLLVWILPATFLMCLVAITYNYFDMRAGLQSFVLLQPMAIGFLVSATIVLYQKAINNLITKIIFILTAVFVFVAFKSPWTIPVIIIIAGIITNFSQKRIPNDGAAPKTLKWGALFIFIFLFLTAGIVSEEATRKNWEQHKLINLFENNYRFGSFVFGGGDVLIPMMYEQYVARPNSDRVKKNKRDVLKISNEAFLMGAGMVRAMPGPVFSVASYTSVMALKEKSMPIQLMGALMGSLAIFLPSFLIVLFFFPIWQNLKKYAIFYRSLEGIYAAVVGVMLGATLHLIGGIPMQAEYYFSLSFYAYIFVFLVSTYLIYKQKIAAQWVVLFTIALGFLLTFLNTL